MDDIEIHYGEVLKALVRKHEVSVKELSERMRMTTQGVYNIFRTKSPRVDVIVEVTEALGVPFNAIEKFGNVKEIREYNEKDAAMFSGKMKDQEGRVIDNNIENREFYTSSITMSEVKMEVFEKALAMADQVIEAKNQLIEQLKKELKSAS